MKFKAVLFDLDGTLANTICDLANSVNFVLNNHGFESHDTATYKRLVGNGIATTIKRALPINVTDEELSGLKAEFVQHYLEHYLDNTVAYDGLNLLISALKEKGVKIAVVTNKEHDVAKKMIFKLFGDVFDIIWGLKSDYPPKPDPTSTLTVMKELGVNPSECAFVGDSDADIQVAINSGAYPVGVLWGFRAREELEKTGAKALAENAEELKNILL